jgi:anti-anti-sigma regulatory factor
MKIVIREAEGKVPVTIMELEGALDASNYLDVIARAQELYAAGTRYLLMDLSNLTSMASSGLMALHSVALIMRGAEPPDPEYGWAAFRTVDKDRDSGFNKHCKLLKPQPPVDRTLEITGFKAVLEIHTDLNTALSSFG